MEEQTHVCSQVKLTPLPSCTKQAFTLDNLRTLWSLHFCTYWTILTSYVDMQMLQQRMMLSFFLPFLFFFHSVVDHLTIDCHCSTVCQIKETHHHQHSAEAKVLEVLVVERFLEESPPPFSLPFALPCPVAPQADPQQGAPHPLCPPLAVAHCPPHIHSPGEGQLLEQMYNREIKIHS